MTEIIQNAHSKINFQSLPTAAFWDLLMNNKKIWFVSTYFPCFSFSLSDRYANKQWNCQRMNSSKKRK